VHSTKNTNTHEKGKGKKEQAHKGVLLLDVIPSIKKEKR
jgi:hypothetical protein